jgi:hypothetical protein
MNLALGKPTQSFRSSMQGGGAGALFAGSAAGSQAPVLFSNSNNKHAR